jgi:hypothetical protein
MLSAAYLFEKFQCRDLVTALYEKTKKAMNNKMNKKQIGIFVALK